MLTAQPDRGLPQVSSEAAPEAPRKRRRSAWGENDGGEVYVKPAGPKVDEEGKGAVPSLAEVLSMSAKDLRKLLTQHGVSMAGCVEKSDFIDLARKLLSTQ